MESTKSSITSMYLFIGKVPLCYMIVGFVLSLFLGAIEFYFALSLQLFLKFMGLITTAVELGRFNITVDSFGSLLILIIGLLVVRFFAQIIQAQVLSYAGERVNFRLRSLVVYDFLNNVSESSNSSSDVFFRFNEIIPKSVGAINVSSQLLASFIQMATFLCIMFSTLYRETFVALLGVMIIGFITIYVSTFLKRVSRHVSEESHLMTVKIQRASRNLLFFKLMRLVNDERKNLTGTLYDLSSYVLRASFLSSISSSLPSLLGGVLLIFVLYLGKNYWHSDGPALISFLYLLVKFVQNLSVLSGQFATFQNYRHQLLLGFEYFRLYPRAELSEAMKFESLVSFTGHNDREKIFNSDLVSLDKGIQSEKTNLPSIQLDNVVHYYRQNVEQTFPSLSLKLDGGEQLGIVGPSGSGKSTLLMLIMGVLRPASGSITISGNTPQSYFESLENRIGYVGAEPYLFRGTLKENLTYGVRIPITEEDIKRALKTSRLEDFYKRVGESYLISEDQTGLSAGQRQRLCLARALLNKPHLLVLDEATANLDKQTEEEIAIDISKLKGTCTVLIVSHQPGMLKFVDKIIAL